MKTFIGILWVFSASIYGVFAVVCNHVYGPILAIIGFVHFILGLYFLFFAKDKPAS